MRYSSIFFVFALICTSRVVFASDIDVNTFIKESSSLLGHHYLTIAKKVHLKKKEERKHPGKVQIYGASNTGLSAETACKSMAFYFEGYKLTTILCNTTENVASEEINKAYTSYAGKGGGAGTGTYFWCINRKGLEISVPMPSQAYIAVHDSCP